MFRGGAKKIFGDWRTERVINAHPQGVMGLAWGPNSHLVISGGKDNLAKLWDARSGGLLREYTGHASWVHGVAISSDGKWVLTAAAGIEDEALRLSDLHSGALVRACAGNGRLEAVSAKFPNPTDRGRSYDADKPKSGGQFWPLAFANDTASALCMPVRFDLRTGEPRQFRPPPPWDVYGGAMTPDGRGALVALERTFVGAPPQAMLCHWDFSTGALQLDFPTFPAMHVCVAISRDGLRALTGGDGGIVRLWDIPSRKLLRTMTKHKNGASVSTVEFSPDGRWSMSCGWDGAVRLCSLDGDHTLALEGHQQPVTAAAFSTDGRFIASGGFDGAIRVWTAS